MRAKVLYIVAMLCMASFTQAQDKWGTWYFGMGQGLHTNTMSFSNLSDASYVEKQNLSSFVVSLFAQGEFGDKGQYGIRPEVAYLKRGGYLNGFVQNGRFIGDYALKANYVDLRLSFIYNFRNADSKFRPYVFVTPVLAFATGGDVSMEAQGLNGTYAGVRSDLSSANIAKSNFGIAPGVGVKWQFRTGSDGRHLCWLGVEASYEIGLTDTYGSKEKNGEATNLMKNARYVLNGTRKFSGFEIKAVLGIPFSVFTKKPVARKVVAEPQPVPQPVVTKQEKPCYSLEEIIEMMKDGENVKGKTFCSIDDINFDFGKSNIKPSSFSYLDKLAEILKKTGVNIIVKGHTDNVGTDEANMNLSRERAKAVVNYLIEKGVKESKLQYDFFGAALPLTSNDTEAGRRLNRRVEFEIQK